MGEYDSHDYDRPWGDSEPPNYDWRQRNGIPLTTHQLIQLEQYRAGQARWRKERAEWRERRVRKWAPVIAEMRYRGKTYEEVAKHVKVAVSTVWCWEQTYPEIFNAELNALVEREHNLTRLVMVRKVTEARNKLANALPGAAEKLAYLSQQAELEKVQLDASKAILSFGGFGKDKAEAAREPYRKERARFVQGVVEKVLPGCTVTQEAEVVEVTHAKEG